MKITDKELCLIEAVTKYRRKIRSNIGITQSDIRYFELAMPFSLLHEVYANKYNDEVRDIIEESSFLKRESNFHVCIGLDMDKVNTFINSYNTKLGIYIKTQKGFHEKGAIRRRSRNHIHSSLAKLIQNYYESYKDFILLNDLDIVYKNLRNEYLLYTTFITNLIDDYEVEILNSFPSNFEKYKDKLDIADLIILPLNNKQVVVHIGHLDYYNTHITLNPNKETNMQKDELHKLLGNNNYVLYTKASISEEKQEEAKDLTNSESENIQLLKNFIIRKVDKHYHELGKVLLLADLGNAINYFLEENKIQKLEVMPSNLNIFIKTHLSDLVDLVDAGTDDFQTHWEVVPKGKGKKLKVITIKEKSKPRVYSSKEIMDRFMDMVSELPEEDAMQINIPTYILAKLHNL